jgi:ribosomal protein S18 acetylase RimI-like enzyme
MGNVQSAISIDAEDPHSAAAQYCLNAYYDELDARFPGGFDRKAGGAAAVGDFVSPHGCLMLVRLEAELVGCGALRTFAPRIGEIKRMWISPQARGLGVGRTLLAALERSAREASHRTVRLDSNASLSEALRLYRTAGYREIERFNDNPYAEHWFEKTLL